MTNKLIDRLEELADEMKLIVAQIRKPSTVVEEALAATTLEDKHKRLTVGDKAKVVLKESYHSAQVGDIVEIVKDTGDAQPYRCKFLNGDSAGWFTEDELERYTDNIIEFEGQKYKKVDREAREGDVVIFTKLPNDSGHDVTKGKPYKAFSNGNGRLEITDDDDYCAYVYGGGLLEGTLETVDVYELIVESKQEINPLPPEPKTANQLRAEIIEKAKRFVEKYTTPNSLSDEWRAKGAISWNGYGVYPKFFINKNKRIVTLIFKGAGNPRKVLKRTFAKCNPSDVFNEHIGKAIALGRALGLDVSEFEQAVQPNQLVVGMEVKLHGNPTGLDFFGKDTFDEVNKLSNGDYELSKNGKGLVDGRGRYSLYKPKFDSIINDTNAIYGGVE